MTIPAQTPPGGTMKNQPPAWSKNAVIYEVNIRQYTPEGTFKAFEKHLPRLRKMGADILWLMPVFPISTEKRKGSLGSYYASSDYKAVNPDYGTMADFDRMLNKAHALGLKVILDIACNHTGWDHVWIKEHPDWYTRDDKGNISVPRDPQGNLTDWVDVADLNYDNKAMREAMVDALRFWLRKGVDGYRYDMAGFVPTDFWEAANRELRKVRKDAFFLAEWEDPRMHDDAMHATYSWEIHHLTKDIAQGKKAVKNLDEYLEKEKGKYPAAAYRMRFTDNHDENSWSGSTRERYGAALDAMSVLLFTIPGFPLIYSGQESGLNKKLLFFDKDQIEWGKYPQAGFYASLCALKHRNTALWNGAYGGQFRRLATGLDDKVYAFVREKGPDRVLVILNLSAAPVTPVIQGKSMRGAFKDAFSGKPVQLKEGASLPLEAWGYRVYSTR